MSGDLNSREEMVRCRSLSCVQRQAVRDVWESFPSDSNLGIITNELFLSRSLRMDGCITKNSFTFWIKWIDDGNPNRKRVRGEL